MVVLFQNGRQKNSKYSKITGDFDKTPKVSSDRGSNSIYVDGDYMGKTCIETSAPIKIIDSKIIQYNVTPIY